MRVQIAARHCEVPESARTRADEQMRKLRKYDPRVSAADIVFQEEGRLKKAEGILSIDRDEPMVASGQGDDFRTAIDRMADRLARRLRRRRSQVTDHQAPKLSEPEKAAAD